MRITFQLIALFVLVAQIATAQEPPSAPVAANPLSENTRGMYDGIQKIVLRSAELMPEENYAFRPVESVRTFGQIVGHIAGSQYYFCATVRGENSDERRHHY